MTSSNRAPRAPRPPCRCALQPPAAKHSACNVSSTHPPTSRVSLMAAAVATTSRRGPGGGGQPMDDENLTFETLARVDTQLLMSQHVNTMTSRRSFSRRELH